MKKPFVMGILLALGAMGGVSQAYAAEQVKSLRGANELDAPSNKVIVKKTQQGREPIVRDYVQQPPLIPHKHSPSFHDRKYRNFPYWLLPLRY